MNIDRHWFSRFSLTTVVAAVVCLQGCSSQSTRETAGRASSAIINGDPGAAGLTSRVVQLRLGNFLCSGTLLTNLWVLTAEHCTRKTSSPYASQSLPYTVFDNQGNQIGTVNNFYIHPQSANVEPSLSLDVALLLLDSPASVNGYTPMSSYSPQIGDSLFCAGYGNGGSAGGPGVLRSATVTVSNDVSNNAPSNPNVFVVNSNSRGQIQAPGDSGGPCFYNGEQVGVYRGGNFTSWADLTKVSAIRNWAIAQILGTEPPPSGTWQRFSMAPAANANIRASNIAAVSRSPEHMETFWIDKNGAVQHAYWDENGQPWQLPRPIAAPGSANTYAGISAVSRTPNTMEVLWIGQDESVQHSSWYDGGEWSPPTAIAPAGSASQYGGIAAVSRASNTVEAFWIGADESVKHAYWYDGQNGGNWAFYLNDLLAPANSASALSNVAVVSRDPRYMEVFWIGLGGSIQHAYYDGVWYFNPARPISSSGASSFGGIAAVSRISNSMEIWWLGEDGSVQDAYWYDGDSDWQRFQLAGPKSAQMDAGIAAKSRIPTSMDVFWVGQDNSVRGAHWYDDGTPWNVNIPIAPAGTASGNTGYTGMAALSRRSDTMEIWWAAGDGSIQDAYWYGWVAAARGTQWSTGFDVDITAEGFSPGASVYVSYDNVPNRGGSATGAIAVNSTGRISYVDTSWEKYAFTICSISQKQGYVLVTATDPATGLSKQTTLPAIYWCSN